MTLPNGYTASPTRIPQDLDEIVRVYVGCDLADVGFEDVVRPHIEASYGAPETDLERDTAVIRADGRIVAIGQCSAMDGGWPDCWGRVHPDHRGMGLGTWLMDFFERRGVELIQAGAQPKIAVSFPSVDAAARTLALGRSYRKVRTFWHMERDLADVDPDPPVPDGFQIRTVDPERDLEALHAGLEEAFADHYGWVAQPLEYWMAETFTSEQWDPELAWLAWEGDQLVGAALSRGGDGIGWVGDLAVRRPWRGRGLGEALLRRSFASLAAKGTSTCGLNVDAASDTGATRLYERAGMTVRRAFDLYEKPLAAGLSSQA